MTDRELLELAGLAAGETYTKEHNPLERDDLALRLAVKLHVPVEAMIAFVAEREPDWADDPLAATRRAIVRAAAEIGRSMK